MATKHIKIRDYAAMHGVQYRTVWNWIKKGLDLGEGFTAYRLPSGSWMIRVEEKDAED